MDFLCFVVLLFIYAMKLIQRKFSVLLKEEIGAMLTRQKELYICFLLIVLWMLMRANLKDVMCENICAIERRL